MLLLWLPLIVATPASQAAAPAYAHYEYFRNPWDCVGLKDYAHGVRVSPEGSFHLPGKRSVAIVLAGGVTLRGALRFLDRGFLPILHLRKQELRIWSFVSPLQPEEKKAWYGPQGTQSFFLHLFFQNEGTGPKELTLRFSGFKGLRAEKTAEGTCLRVAGGKFAGVLWKREAGLSQADLHFTLGPSRTVSCAIVAFPQSGEEAVPRQDLSGKALRACRAFWLAFLSEGAYLSVPEDKVQHAYNASIVGNFIARDKGTLKPGEGFYDNFYLRDGAFQLRALLAAGFRRHLKESLKDFLACQKPDGRFESQRGELDGNGQALWAFWSWWDLTRDRSFLQRIYPACERSARWIAKARRQEKGPPSGILFRSLADGEYLWKGDCHIVGYDFWNLRGLACVADMGRNLGKDVTWILKEYQNYKHAIEKTLAERNFSFFPPSFEGRGTSWGNLTAAYPTVLFDPHDPRLTETLKRERSSFVEGTIRWRGGKRKAIHPYLSTYITNTEILRGEVSQAVNHFYHFLCHSSATNAFPEGVYWEDRLAWNNTIPHQWASAQYILLLRNMLLSERNRELHLLPAVPVHWLNAGKNLALRNFPTSFGPFTLTVSAHKDTLRLSVRVPATFQAQRLICHLPAGIRRAAAGPGPADRIRLPARSGTYTITISRLEVSPAAFQEYTQKYMTLLRLRIR